MFGGVAAASTTSASRPSSVHRDSPAPVTLHRVAEARAAGAEVVYLLTEDPRVERSQMRRGFVPGFELVGWTPPAEA
jgi:hypothetical protein